MSRWCSNQLSYVPAVGRILLRFLQPVNRNMQINQTFAACPEHAKNRPKQKRRPFRIAFFCCRQQERPDLVGTIGLEPTTPTMSRWCSNQLSYVPAVGRILLRFLQPVNRNMQINQTFAACPEHAKNRPKQKRRPFRIAFFCCRQQERPDLVGTIGLEPTTPTMSRWCSNQLSYVPAVRRHSTELTNGVNSFFRANSLNIKNICGLVVFRILNTPLASVNYC